MNCRRKYIKNFVFVSVFLLLVIAFAGCNKEEKVTNSDVVDILQDIKKDGDYTGQIIDSLSLDIDCDGIVEVCSIYTGPTSGVYSFLITASVDGNVKYKDLFVVSPSELAFDNTDNVPCIVVNGEKHRISIMDKHLVIEDLK